MGAEPETLAIGTVGGEKVFFIGNERSSSVEIYSVRHAITQPLFHNITSVTPFADVGKTWSTLYTERNTGDLHPEGIEFIAAGDTPAEKPLLLVSGSVSGSLSVYIVSKVDEIEDDLLANKVNSLFDSADFDKDQLISRHEHERMVMEADLDSNHMVDKEEFFIAFSVKVGLLKSKSDYVFNELDADNNRVLTASDTYTLFYLGDRDATAMLARDQFGREWKRILHENIDLTAAQ